MLNFGAKEIGSFNKLGLKVLAGYELQDGKCVKLWDPVPAGQVLNNYPGCCPNGFDCDDSCICDDCRNLCQASRINPAEDCQAFDEEGGEEDQSEACRKEKLESHSSRLRSVTGIKPFAI